MALEDLAYIDSTGFHFADYPTDLAYFQQGMRDIYGNDVYLEPDSQDGALVALFSRAFYQGVTTMASVFNSMSPATAQGVGLSRNVKINGINRRVATKSTVDLTVVGTAGTTITGGIAIDTLEQKWDLPITVIPGGGSIVVTATAQVAGALNALANTVNRIFTPTRGWQTVNNATAASVGEAVETDAELRIRQSNSTAIPSLTVFDGTVGAVQDVPGVTNARGYENDTNTTDSNGIPAHTICVVVEGGSVTDICQAIQVHKTPGTGTFGDTGATVTDAHGMPLLIKFQRSDQAVIQVNITGNALDGWSSDYATLIKQAVADYVNSVGIGNPVLYTKIFIPAYLVGTAAAGTFDISLLQIGKDGSPPAEANATMDFDELPFSDPLVNVSVTIT